MNRELESGQVLSLTVISMVVLIGFVALSVDVGLLWSERRHMQTAADAAAIAGATALRLGNDVTTAADDVSALNG
ncbi:MAG: pilus assembly protein TadG-related protein, partial [Polyangiaceae bacterium]